MWLCDMVCVIVLWFVVLCSELISVGVVLVFVCCIVSVVVFCVVVLFVCCCVLMYCVCCGGMLDCGLRCGVVFVAWLVCVLCVLFGNMLCLYDMICVVGVVSLRFVALVLRFPLWCYAVLGFVLCCVVLRVCVDWCVFAVLRFVVSFVVCVRLFGVVVACCGVVF